MCQLLGRHLTAQPAPSSSCNGLALLDVDFVLNCLLSRLQAACKQPALILHDDNICVVVVVGMGQPQPRVSRAYTPDGPSWGCLRQLKHLDLASTKTGRHGCRALQALRGHLTSLRLGGPFVDDAACIAVARQGPSLLCLHLHGVLLTAPGSGSPWLAMGLTGAAHPGLCLHGHVCSIPPPCCASPSPGLVCRFQHFWQFNIVSVEVRTCGSITSEGPSEGT